MPQPKKSSASPSRGGSRKRPAPELEPVDEAGLKEQLQKLLVPLDAVLLTRDRLQEVVDDAVQRGRMTRTDASELMTEIFSRGRRTTEDILSDVDQLLGGPADRVRREVDRARRATGLGGPSGGGFPIKGYEQLTAAQVQGSLDGLSAADLRKVRDYEKRNANRKTVLAAIESRLG